MWVCTLMDRGASRTPLLHWHRIGFRALPSLMVKRLLSFLGQFLGFCALLFVGGYWAWVRLTLEMRAMEKGETAPPLIPLWKMHVSPTLDYVLNGLVFASVLLVILLLVQALRRKLGNATLLTLGALVAAFLLSLLFHSGFVIVTPAS